MGAGHGGMGGFVVEEARGFGDDPGRVRAHEARRTGRNPLGPLGRLAHDQHRLAERERLFLHPATVGQDEMAGVEQRHEFRIVERGQKRDIGQAAEPGLERRAEPRIGVQREQDGDVLARGQRGERVGNGGELAEIFAAVGTSRR